MSWSDKTTTIFVCGTDWDCELGQTWVETFASESHCAEGRAGCVDECGIVELEVKFLRWVRKPRAT